MPGPLARLLSPDGPGNLRVLVVVAHPDDEVLACGALLARLPSVRVVHATDGAPRDPAEARRHGFATSRDYAAARAAEAEVALALAGHPTTSLTSLGVADQEASLYLAALARALARTVADADVVLTHAYEGGHSDHDAVAFAVAAALRLADAGPTPLLVEMPFYRAAVTSDETGPPLRQAGKKNAVGDVHEPWVRQRFLPHPGAGDEGLLRLDTAATDRKLSMLAAHRTQAETVRSFAVDAERYRVAPAYDFHTLPHDGDLLYERHGWSLTGPLWLERVAAATAELGLVAAG